MKRKHTRHYVMESDVALVQRLSDPSDAKDIEAARLLMQQAADRIKALEAALLEIYHLPPHLGSVPNEILNIATRALLMRCAQR
jgi:hypothetical protein